MNSTNSLLIFENIHKVELPHRLQYPLPAFWRLLPLGTYPQAEHPEIDLYI